MKQFAKRVLSFGLFVYVGVIVLLMLLETALMYPAPDPRDGDWNPAWLKYEEAEFTSEDGTTIHGWFCEHPQPEAVVLVCHGNGEHVAYMAEELEYLRDRFQVSVMAFDYRGYGKSAGKPFEDGLLADGIAAREWLSQRTGLPPESIILWGRSLGGAIATHLASESGAKGLVLDRTFSSMVDVASTHYPWLPVRWLLRNRYPSAERIKQYDGPLIQIHGHPDRVVPFSSGRELFESAPTAHKTFLESQTLAHNSAWPDEYYEHVGQFIAGLK